MTVEGRPAKPGDPEASLRENLAAQVSAAQSELSANLIELRSQGGDPALIGQADAQLGALLALKSQIERAGSGALATMGTRVAACVATATTLAQHAQAASSGVAARAATELGSASEAARAKVTSFVTDFYERKIFDPYLEFSSEAEKEAYREREAARRKAIEEAQALRTPQGDLRAANLAIEQLEDAGTHGADRSPEYGSMLNGMKQSRQSLAAQLQQHSQSRGEPAPHSEADPIGADAPKGSAVGFPPDVIAALGRVQVAEALHADHGLAPSRSPGPAPTRAI
ncbi:MAG: hypothetical protein EPN98_14020 [Phenylobacterium sp.]|uniref:hypothetical protein n=1 Tax=Phenylobacterium sp. TaxID=1871053 RepID=UPI00121BC8F8|nr:hypothetical protein [Phenylobacterium sp.]TAL32263.1 MAG: hypothetical protein EPN98_14020 [Phenylobacterium sp.]